MIKYLLPFLFLCASTANAQRAVILQLPNGQYVGLVYLANGETVLIPTVQVIKLPGPDPTPPPIVKTVVKAIVLIESGDSTVQTTLIKASIRNSPERSRKIFILDPDTEDENGVKDKRVLAALAFIGNQSLPVLVGFGGDDKPSAFVPLGGDTATVDAQLKKWGL